MVYCVLKTSFFCRLIKKCPDEFFGDIGKLRTKIDAMAQEGPKEKMIKQRPPSLPGHITPTLFLSMTTEKGIHPFHIFNLLSSS